MHPHAVLLHRFFTAFAARDGATMAACYLPDAHFDDELFALDGARIGSMWQMLTASARDFSLTFSGVAADDTNGQAHWEARYRFSRTGRPVINRIDSSFSFRDGLILRQRDTYDFWSWSRQALGLPGLLLGWSGFLRAKVRAQAAAGLEQYLRR
jgi:ketosteroid isomerase-like protein